MAPVLAARPGSYLLRVGHRTEVLPDEPIPTDQVVGACPHMPPAGPGPTMNVRTQHGTHEQDGSQAMVQTTRENGLVMRGSESAAARVARSVIENNTTISVTRGPPSW
jgi:hypothetical protein